MRPLIRTSIWVALGLITLGAAPPQTSAGLGSPAPAVQLTSLAGAPMHLTGAGGKVTVLNFWASWCPPCRAETPDLNAAYRRLHAADVDFLGIDTTETAPIVKTFISAKGVPYPVALAGAGVYNAYGISYIPTTIVLDRDGIVRSRWIGEVTPGQLAKYVAAARAGRSSTDASPVQAQIDALLAPQRYIFAGDAAQRDAAVAAMKRALSRADTIVEQNQASADYERTQREKGALLVAAGTAQRHAARTEAQKIEALTLLGQGSGDLNAWDAAAGAYREALAIKPDAPKLVAALARAYYRLHDYSAMIEQSERYTALRPADGDGWSDLGLANQRARRFRAAAPAYEKSLKLLQSEAAKKPAQDAFADVADTALDAADVYVSIGDTAGTRRMFTLANTFVDQLAPGGRFATLKRNVKERTQEGFVAVALAHGSERAVVSVMPWTGPDLPGSLASTFKYRLIVAARADEPVTLRARGLRPQWVASFCADGLCSPQTVSFKSPPGGVKTYEFQLVPPRSGARPGGVAIAVGGGSVVPVPTAK